jgi:hypothetical protein
MKKITQEQITTISNYLINSMIPSKDAQTLVNLLRNLPPIEEDSKTSKDHV